MGREFYDADGHVLYEKLAQSPSFLEGIKFLVDVAQNRLTAMMCREEKPL